jgi:membrane fusion protein, heavy metal efflux system
VPILCHGGGRLVYLGTSVDPKTRAVALVYEVPNPDGRLRIGMALTVYVETAHVEEALVVPVAALVDEDGRAVAFVQVSGETFEKRDLTLGIRDGEFVQILAGLAAGERVVTKGGYAVRLASVSTTIPAHGHAH